LSPIKLFEKIGWIYKIKLFTSPPETKHLHCVTQPQLALVSNYFPIYIFCTSFFLFSFLDLFEQLKSAVRTGVPSGGSYFIVTSGRTMLWHISRDQEEGDEVMLLFLWLLSIVLPCRSLSHGYDKRIWDTITKNAYCRHLKYIQNTQSLIRIDATLLLLLLLFLNKRNQAPNLFVKFRK
jgi:hypothetical protein